MKRRDRWRQAYKVIADNDVFTWAAQFVKQLRQTRRR